MPRGFPYRKITPELAEQIVARYSSGHFTQAQLAALFYVSPRLVGELLRGRSPQGRSPGA